MIQTDDGKEFVNKIFTDLLEKNNFERYSRYRSVGAAFAEHFNRTIRDLLKKPVFEKSDSNYVDVPATITKQNKNRIRSSTKLTPIQASLKKDFTIIH